MPVETRSRAGLSQGVVLTLAPILAVMGFVLVAPVLSLMQVHFQSVPHAEFWVPMVMTVPALCIAILSPAAGLMVDRMGARRVLLGALAIYTVFGAAPLYLDSLAAIVATRVGVGVAEAAILTCTTALVGGYFQGDERQRWLAYQAGAAPAAATLLLVMGGVIGSKGWRFPFAGYALSAVVLLATLRYVWEPPRPERERQENLPFPWPHLLKVVTFALFASFIFYIVPAEMAFILAGHSITSSATVGFLIAIGTAFVPVGTLSSRPLARLPEALVLCCALALMGLGLIVIGTANSLPGIAVGVVLQQFAGGVMLPTAMNYAMNGLDARLQGRGMGLWWSAYFIAQFLTPILVTLMIKVTGNLDTALIVYGIASVVFCLPTWLFARPSR